MTIKLRGQLVMTVEGGQVIAIGQMGPGKAKKRKEEKASGLGTIEVRVPITRKTKGREK